MLTFVGYVVHSSLSICISYTSMLAISFTSFLKKIKKILNMNGVLCYFTREATYEGK